MGDNVNSDMVTLYGVDTVHISWRAWSVRIGLGVIAGVIALVMFNVWSFADCDRTPGGKGKTAEACFAQNFSTSAGIAAAMTPGVNWFINSVDVGGGRTVDISDQLKADNPIQYINNRLLLNRAWSGVKAAEAEIFARAQRWALGTFTLVLGAIVYVGRRVARRESKTQVLEGTEILQFSDIQQTRKHIHPFCGLKLTAEQITGHCGVIGSTGSGKSSQLLIMIANWKHRQVLYSRKGDETAIFYRPDHDVIIDLTDSRGVAWTITDEIRAESQIADINMVCKMLIPNGEGTEQYWNRGARDVLIGIVIATFYRINEFGEGREGRFNRRIYQLCGASPADLIKYMSRQNSAGEFEIIPGCEPAVRSLTEIRLATSILSVLLQYTLCLKWLPDHEGANNGFTITNYVKNGGVDQRIFVHARQEVEAMLAPVNTLVFDLVASRGTSQLEPGRPIQIMIDEFPSLQKLESIMSLIKEARSFGIHVVLGTQGVEPIQDRYGVKGAEVILANLNNMAIMRIGGTTSPQFASDIIGKQRVRENIVNKQIRMKESGDGRGWYSTTTERDAIMASDISKLERGEAIVKLAWQQDWARGQAPYIPYKKVQPTWQQRRGMSVNDLATMQSEAEKVSAEARRVIAYEPVPDELKQAGAEAAEANTVLTVDQRKRAAELAADSDYHNAVKSGEIKLPDGDEPPGPGRNFW